MYLPFLCERLDVFLFITLPVFIEIKFEFCYTSYNKMKADGFVYCYQEVYIWQGRNRSELISNRRKA